jgi:hypothetical protein
VGFCCLFTNLSLAFGCSWELAKASPAAVLASLCLYLTLLG